MYKLLVKPSSKLSFLTLRARLVFDKLRQIFIKPSNLFYFNLKCHIKVETDGLGYAIGDVLSQLSLDNLGQ